MPVERQTVSTAVHPVMTYGTTSYADIMAMLHSVRITPEVKAHVGRRLMKESESRYLTDAYEKLDHLATLKQDWDGYGALPISPAVLDNVKAVLLISDNDDWKEWLIAPDSNATLCLEAKNTGASISTIDSLAATAPHFSHMEEPDRNDVKRVNDWWQKRLESMRYVEKRYIQ